MNLCRPTNAQRAINENAVFKSRNRRLQFMQLAAIHESIAFNSCNHRLQFMAKPIHDTKCQFMQLAAIHAACGNPSPFFTREAPRPWRGLHRPWRYPCRLPSRYQVCRRPYRRRLRLPDRRACLRGRPLSPPRDLPRRRD